MANVINHRYTQAFGPHNDVDEPTNSGADAARHTDAVEAPTREESTCSHPTFQGQT